MIKQIMKEIIKQRKQLIFKQDHGKANLLITFQKTITIKSLETHLINRKKWILSLKVYKETHFFLFKSQDCKKYF